jgi:hypothetical protein
MTHRVRWAITVKGHQLAHNGIVGAITRDFGCELFSVNIDT